MLEEILAIVSEVTEYPIADLRGQENADLITDLGVDSIKLAEIWERLENHLGLDPGSLVFQQLTTMAGIALHLAARTE